MENYSEKQNYSDLTPEENKILDEINDILKLSECDDCVKVYQKRQVLIRDFIHELEKKGLVLNNYILGRRLRWSTPHEGINEFDTPNNDIANFIRNKIKNIK